MLKEGYGVAWSCREPVPLANRSARTLNYLGYPGPCGDFNPASEGNCLLCAGNAPFAIDRTTSV